MELRLDRRHDWIRDIRRVRSPNFDERPAGTDISLVVVHGISLPPRQYGGHFIDDLFTNTLDPERHPYFAEIHHLRVSTHLLIDRRGGLTQYVPFTRRAWHAGESAFQGCPRCNDFSIGVELEGCDEEPYETAQYQRLAEVGRLIMRTWPTVTPGRFAGHSDISPGRKTDPGPCFDWDYFRDLLV